MTLLSKFSSYRNWLAQVRMRGSFFFVVFQAVLLKCAGVTESHAQALQAYLFHFHLRFFQGNTANTVPVSTSGLCLFAWMIVVLRDSASETGWMHEERFSVATVRRRRCGWGRFRLWKCPWGRRRSRGRFPAPALWQIPDCERMNEKGQFSVLVPHRGKTPSASMEMKCSGMIQHLVATDCSLIFELIKNFKGPSSSCQSPSSS